MYLMHVGLKLVNSKHIMVLQICKCVYYENITNRLVALTGYVNL